MRKSSFSRIVAGCSMLVVLAAGMAPLTGFSQVIGDPFKDITLGPPVRITSPANHAVFYAPVDIPIFVFTRSEAEFTNVELYANGVAIGSASSLAATNRPVAYFSYALPTPFVARFRSLWCLVWSNAPAGSYALTAVASGVMNPAVTFEGLNRTSAPVNVTILSSTNGTNPMDIVNIIATDPIAIAGTNMSWVWAGLTNKVPSWTNWPPPRWGYFTNWGPKPALFTVRRFGDASDALMVNYSIGGTASNGVDYAALPGSLNIPAGSGYGLIPIVPIDNSSNNVVKTVVLKLSASTNVPPDYNVGVPKQAEALIVYRWPRAIPILLGHVLPPVGGSLPDGAFHFSVAGPDGAWFTLQNSTDLVNWTSICTNQVVQGSVDFIDPNASGTSSGFYQVVTNSPPQ
jgi:hypothetical protein